jgi:hypothetical protein
MSRKDKKAAFRVLSGMFVNLSAGWFGVIIISPNFLPVLSFREIFILTQNVLAGILCLWISFVLERKNI